MLLCLWYNAYLMEGKTWVILPKELPRNTSLLWCPIAPWCPSPDGERCVNQAANDLCLTAIGNLWHITGACSGKFGQIYDIYAVLSQPGIKVMIRLYFLKKRDPRLQVTVSLGQGYDCLAEEENHSRTNKQSKHIQIIIMLNNSYYFQNIPDGNKYGRDIEDLIPPYAMVPLNIENCNLCTVCVKRNSWFTRLSVCYDV